MAAEAVPSLWQLWMAFDHKHWRLSHGVLVALAFECCNDTAVTSSSGKDSPRSHRARDVGVVDTPVDNSVTLGNISPPSMAQHALVEVLKTNKCIPTNLDCHQALLQPLLTLLSQVGFQGIWRPNGGFCVLAKLLSGVDDASFASSLMEESVFLLPGTIFGMPGFLGFCALVSKDSLTFAMAHNVLKKALAKRQQLVAM